jgi:UbiD family decarboxylase
MFSHAFNNLRSLINQLENKNLLVRINEPVDPHLEIAEIHRRVVARGGPALLFENVKGSRFRVVTNLFGTPERVNLALGNSIHQLIEQAVNLAHGPQSSNKSSFFKQIWQQRKLIPKLLKIGTKTVNFDHFDHHKNLTLNDLPFLTSWPYDGGPFLTLPLVYTTDPSDSSLNNFGMYRIQRYNSHQAGLHFQIGKGGGFHLYQAELLRQNLPVSIFLGGSPALIASAIAPLPENISEWLLASAMQEEKLKVSYYKNWPHPIPIDVEFAILGHALNAKRALEGPFGDHYGYYSLAHEFPLLDVQQVLAKPDAIYPATVVGKPPQEDLYLGNWLQELLSPLIKMVMPGIVNLWSYGQTGFHALSAAQVKQRYEREALTHALRILGEGQLSLTKFLLITDHPVNLKDFKKTLEAVLERFTPEKDLYIFSQVSLDTLDYTGPKLNHGSRGILIGTGSPIRQLFSSFSDQLPSPFIKFGVFCAGCLVVQGSKYTLAPNLAKELLVLNLIQWPLIILVDDLDASLRSESDFLWTVFMRFEPARDIYTKATLAYHHLMHELPIVIDARMKPFYPPVVEVDDRTDELVSKRWKDYF